MEARREALRCKCLVTCEMPEVGEDMCRYLQPPMEPFIETGQHLWASSWMQFGIYFGQLKGQLMAKIRATEPVPTHYVQGS